MKTWKLRLAAGFTVLLTAGLSAGESLKDASLCQRLGGRSALEAVIDEFATRIFADNRLSQWFGPVASNGEHAAAYKAKLGDFICQATGGPCKYTGMDMFAVHKGRAITTEAFNAVVEDLVASLDKFKVPEREKNQLIGILAPMKPAIVQE